MIFLNTQLVILLIIIYIFSNFPSTGPYDLLNIYVVKYETTFLVVSNNFPTLNLHFLTNNTFQKSNDNIYIYIRNTAFFL